MPRAAVATHLSPSLLLLLLCAPMDWAGAFASIGSGLAQPSTGADPAALPVTTLFALPTSLAQAGARQLASPLRGLFRWQDGEARHGRHDDEGRREGLPAHDHQVAARPEADGDDLITRRVRVNDRASHAGAQLSASDCSAACGACAWHVACDASLKVDFWLGGVWMCGLSSKGCRVLSPNVPLRPSESVGCVACV